MWLLAREALREIWPALGALGLSCTISLILFPFFTYVPTSGYLGEMLPKVRRSCCCCRACYRRRCHHCDRRCHRRRCHPCHCCRPCCCPCLLAEAAVPDAIVLCINIIIRCRQQHAVPGWQRPFRMHHTCFSAAQTLFFARIFADVVGRFLPRLPWLALQNPLAVLAVAFGKLACESS